MPEYAGLHNSSHPKLMYCNMSGRFLFFFLLLLLAASCAAPRWRREKLAPGLEWRHTRTSRLYQSRQNINVLKVDTRRRQIALAFVTDTVFRTSWLAQADSAALAAVNAGFFKIREGRGSATYLRVRGRTIDALPAQGYPHLNGALILHEQGAPGIEYAQPNAVYNARPADETILVTGPVLLLQGEEQSLKQGSDFVALRHPRIVSTLAEGIIGSHAVVVTAVVPGESLEDLLSRERSIPWPEILRLGVGMLEALAVLHDADVVHGALRASSVPSGLR